ncbi:flavin reductase family protein [Aeromicrobium ginsengisoli]|uniref:Flavin reductase family protein n=1 Tax=Aeromicrobium ginsengisoli TaxID=363867 RepID=A0A5M4FIM4_9ACTN|nr:flavin reductase family protein [Aeromicrobium ginsengisoli]KAA1400034.1 flavin reductase family protein [Aeromicrobium ginsengisoli]
MTITTQTRESHTVIDPAILYFGTPVVLVTSVNPGGSSNIMPMSSAFWLGHTGVLGIGARSQTAANLQRNLGCVLNLPSVDLVTEVDRLALTTGRPDVPPAKADRGYRYEPDKFARAGLTELSSDTVAAARIAECPVNLEAHVVDMHPVDDGILMFEVQVSRVHVHDTIRMAGTDHRIDPDLWRPLIMSFQHFYGLGDRVHPSRLASIDEELYR